MPAIVFLLEEELKSSLRCPLGCIEPVHVNNFLTCFQSEHIILSVLEGHNAEPFGVSCDRFAPSHPRMTLSGLL